MDISSDWKMAIIFVIIIVNAYIWNRKKSKEPPKHTHEGWKE